MKRIKYKNYLWLVMAVLVIILIVWIIWGNTALKLTHYTVKSEALPQSFNGFRIAQVSDLHNAKFGSNNEKLLNMLRDTQPDIIVLTGDLVDSRNTDIEIALSFAEAAVTIAPTYYVSGNHEARIFQYDELKEGLKAAGVMILENQRVLLERNGQSILLLGMNDPSFYTDYLFGDSEDVTQQVLDILTKEDDPYTVFISHRPELFETYAQSSVDLVFSGHAHGGQFRLPFIGGLYAPNQGFLPEYDAGLFTKNDTNMIVSRGLGNSIFPFRINNRPEIVVAELICE